MATLHNKAIFTSFDVIAFELFTFKNVEVGNQFSMCTNVREHQQPFLFIWKNGMHQFGSNLGEHKQSTITTSMCTRFITIPYPACSVVMWIISLLLVFVECCNIIRA
jgi:hypothetical protein